MKRLLLLDADVVIDLHSLSLFEKICRAYDVYVTQEVYEEATYFKKGGSKNPINIADKVIVIKDVDLEDLEKVEKEAKQARLVIDPGELTSIAYINQTEEKMIFCSCDKAAMKLVSYMELEQKSVSLERALRDIGYHKRNLYPRHLEKIFKAAINEGKTLRIQFKKLS